MINDFNEGPGKEKGVILEVVPDNTPLDKAKADVKAGESVDIMQLTFSRMPDMKNLGVQAYDDVFTQEQLDELYEGIPENCVQLGYRDGKNYNLAWTFSTPILYLNKTLLNEAGIDANEPPKDWDEMYEWAKQVKEKTGKHGLAFSPTNGWVHESIFLSNGGSTFNEDGTKAVFNEKPAVEAVESWKRFYAEDLAVGLSDSEELQSFMAGNAAMHIQSTSVYSGIVSAFEENGWELDGFPMPGFNGQDSIPVNSGSGLAVNPKDEKHAEAIFEVVKFLTSEESFTVITEQIGYLPLRPYIAEDENFLKSFVEENPIIKRNIDKLDSIKSGTKWPEAGFPETRGIFEDYLQKALLTDGNVQELADQAAEQINSYLN